MLQRDIIIYIGEGEGDAMYESDRRDGSLIRWDSRRMVRFIEDG